MQNLMIWNCFEASEFCFDDLVRYINVFKTILQSRVFALTEEMRQSKEHKRLGKVYQQLTSIHLLLYLATKLYVFSQRFDQIFLSYFYK